MSAVTEGKPCVPFQPSKEPISYQPFFGKYASTGESSSGETGEGATHKAKRKSGGGAHKNKGGGGGGQVKIEVPQAAAPRARERPSEPPGLGKTGGAAPR
jgi:hypothetical protein